MVGFYVLKKNIDHVPSKSQINKLIIFDFFFLSPFTLNYNVSTLLLQEFKIRTRESRHPVLLLPLPLESGHKYINNI